MQQTTSRCAEQGRHRRNQLRSVDNRRNYVIRCIKGISILLLPVIFYVVWVNYYAAKMVEAYMWRGNLAVTVMYGIILMLLVRVFRGYEIGNLEWPDVFISHLLAEGGSNCVFYLLSFFLCERFVSPLPLLLLQAVEMAVIFALVRLADFVYWNQAEKMRLVVLYRDEEDLLRLQHLTGFLRRFAIEKQLPVENYSHEILAELSETDAVLIVGVDADVRNGVLKDCISENISAYLLPKVGDILLRGANVNMVSGEMLFQTSQAGVNPEYLFAKRLLDILASILGLIVTSPIFLITGLAIKLEDGGPVFYRQVRLTQDRKEFHILKFRSMRIDAEKDGKARLASENDDRITKVGHFIRACRIDELPQLLNILQGSMTLVGPRPERPEIAEQYEECLPAFALRLQVKAGLTGYAQLFGRYNSEPYEKLQMDLMYITQMSFIEDIKLLFGTFRILFQKESTSGVEDGQVTADRSSQKE